jgi:two-component system chemotaxis sensor kinase CheA
MDDLLHEFLTETSESLNVMDAQLVQFEQEPSNIKILDYIFRLIHTIKGGCGFLGLSRLEALVHAVEALMDKFREGAPATSESISVILLSIDRIKLIIKQMEQLKVEPEGEDSDILAKIERMALNINDRELNAATDDAAKNDKETPAALEHLRTRVAELMLVRDRFLEISSHREESELKGSLQRLSQTAAKMHGSAKKMYKKTHKTMYMQPIGNAWRALPYIVRNLARELGKSITLEMSGVGIELDCRALELIKDSLIHIVRNAADHGLETPQERAVLKKPEAGKISLSARHEGRYAIIEIADDGRGLDIESIKRKALKKGLASKDELEKMPISQIQKFIFAPGFSTAARVSTISGRGVGMDVVRTHIDKIGGIVDLRSAKNKGTAIIIKIPLTLAITPALQLPLAPKLEVA